MDDKITWTRSQKKKSNERVNGNFSNDETYIRVQKCPMAIITMPYKSLLAYFYKWHDVVFLSRLSNVIVNTTRITETTKGRMRKITLLFLCQRTLFTSFVITCRSISALIYSTCYSLSSLYYTESFLYTLCKEGACNLPHSIALFLWLKTSQQPSLYKLNHYESSESLNNYNYTISWKS